MEAKKAMVGIDNMMDNNRATVMMRKKAINKFNSFSIAG